MCLGCVEYVLVIWGFWVLFFRVPGFFESLLFFQSVSGLSFLHCHIIQKLYSVLCIIHFELEILLQLRVQAISVIEADPINACNLMTLVKN